MSTADIVVFDEEEYMLFQDYRGSTKEETDRNLRAALIYSEEDPYTTSLIQGVLDQLKIMPEEAFQKNEFMHFLEFDPQDLEAPEKEEEKS